MPKEIDELRWVRAFSPDLIPKYLVEQVRDRQFTVEDFYKYQQINCTIDSKTGPTLCPFNHLYVLADKENMVKGFLWFIVDPLTKNIIINTFSMDEAYWYNGKAVEKLTDHVKMIMKKLDIKKVYWVTRYPKHSIRHGFKKSKSVLMEYTEVEESCENAKTLCELKKGV